MHLNAKCNSGKQPDSSGNPGQTDSLSRWKDGVKQ